MYLLKRLLALVILLLPPLIFAQTTKDNGKDLLNALETPIWYRFTDENPNIGCPFEYAYLYDSVIIRKTGGMDCQTEGLYGINKKTGELLWNRDIAIQIDTFRYGFSKFKLSGLVEFFKNRIICCEADTLYCYDVSTGEKKWTYANAAVAFNDLYIKDSIIYISSEDKAPTILALDLINGKVRWISEKNPDCNKLLYAYEAGKIIMHGDSGMTCVDLKQHKVLWRLPELDAPGMFRKYTHDTAYGYSFQSAHHDTAFCGLSTRSNKHSYVRDYLLAINMTSGRIIHEFEIGGKKDSIGSNILQGVYIANNSAIIMYQSTPVQKQTDTNFSFCSVSLNSFKKMWDTKIGDKGELYCDDWAADSTQFYYTFNHLAGCIDIKTGTKIWSKKLDTNYFIWSIWLTQHYVVLSGLIEQEGYFIGDINKNNQFQSNFAKPSWSPKIYATDNPDFLFISDTQPGISEFKKVEIK